MLLSACIPLLKNYFLLILCCLLLQAGLGHLQYGVVAKYQPATAAAIEGYYSSSEPEHYYLLAVTNSTTLQTAGLHLPVFIERKMTKNFTRIAPLESYNPDDVPKVDAVFYGFRAMLLGWGGLTGISFVSYTSVKRGRYRRVFAFTAVAYITAMLTIIAGGIVSESGRQPWIIYGVLRTSQSVSLSGGVNPLILLLNFVSPVLLLVLWFKLQKAELVRFIRS